VECKTGQSGVHCAEISEMYDSLLAKFVQYVTYPARITHSQLHIAGQTGYIALIDPAMCTYFDAISATPH